ncbi:MAG: tetratricopeptide repeat protein [Dysgonamonadaceae bacterium]|jgi:tetratricopeptide (TPR) repeat protein|nr:tetratricopeptide repeat protein [Dysgonamonadaceae bacterium]
MNTKKILLVILVALYCFSGAYASKNDKGIDYYRAELYDAAKLFFQQQTNLTKDEQAENYYYLGQVYAATQNLDSAAYFYKKAVETDPEYPYGYIGEGMLQLNKNSKEGTNAANDLFKKAIGFAKKDPAIATAVAEAYINVKMYDQAEEALMRARKIKKDYSGIYIAEGDMLMSKSRVGDASGKYETAIRFNPKDKTAYLKYARVYKTINPSLSLENLEKLLAVDPDYMPAYAELGDLYYRGIDGVANYNKAIEAYERIMNIPGVPLTQETRYAQLLFFTDRYQEADALINNVLRRDPNNYVMKRIRSYNNFKLEKYTEGLELMTTFMKETKQEDLISLDYTYYGRYLTKAKQYDLAVENLKKGYEQDTSKFEMLKEIADAYQALSNRAEAVAYQEKYLNSNPDPAALDYFYLGQTAYVAAVSLYNPEVQISPEDSIQRDKYIETAEKAFTTVKERLPESYMGYLWLGNIINIKDVVINGDKAQGLAKPYYEQALPILLESNENGRRNREIISIYNFLGAYYIQTDDSKSSQEYFNKILELDPNNERAKQILEGFEKK